MLFTTMHCTLNDVSLHLINLLQLPSTNCVGTIELSPLTGKDIKPSNNCHVWYHCGLELLTYSCERVRYGCTAGLAKAALCLAVPRGLAARPKLLLIMLYNAACAFRGKAAYMPAILALPGLGPSSSSTSECNRFRGHLCALHLPNSEGLRARCHKLIY
jgi:hypothetical protein